MADPDDEIRELRELIITLDGLIAAAALDDEDLPALYGHRGLARLDLYARLPAPGEVELAIADLRRSVVASDDEDWAIRCYALGHALLEAVGVDAAQEALGWLTKAFDRGHPDVDRDEVGLDVGQLAWDLYAWRRDPDRLAELIVTLRGLDLRAPVARAVWATMLGAALEERFSLNPDAWGDLDEAVALLEPAVELLPDDFEAMPDAYASLYRAYHARFRRDRDRASVDRMIAAAWRGAERVGSGDERWLQLRQQHLVALDDRFELVGDHADRDAFVAGARELAGLSPAMDPVVLMMLGYHLRQRGEDYRRPEDLAEAIGWFSRAAGEPEADDELAASAWLEVARTHWLRRQLVGGGVAELPPLLSAVDRALALGLADADDELSAHILRLQGDRLLTDHEVAGGRTPEAATAEPMRRLGQEARAVVRRRADGDPELRAICALHAASAIVSASARDERVPDVAACRELLAIARADLPDDPVLRQLLAITEVPLRLYDDVFDRGGRGDFGLPPLTAELDRNPDSPLAELRGLVGRMRDLFTGRRSPAGSERPEQAREPDDCIAGMSAAAQRGETEVAVAWARRGLELLGPGPDTRASADSLRSMFTLLIAGADLEAGRIPSVTPTAPGLLVEGMINSQLAAPLHIMRAGIVAATRAREGDGPGADAARDEFVRLVDAAIADGFVPTLLAAVNAAQTLLTVRGGDRDLAGRAVVWGERAVAAIDPGHPAWATTLMALARIGRDHLDQAGDGRRWGLEALRGHAWTVLLQSDVDSALIAAGLATKDAATVAGWCVDDGALADAVRAIDAGRALVLNAATATARVHDALVALGETELAKRWLEQASTRAQAPAYTATAEELRGRVVWRLTEAGALAGLLDPPGVEEITAALVATGQQALVYLVGDPGFALMVLATGELRHVRLPGLAARAALTAYLASHDASADEADPGFDAWRGALDALCDWAWPAAVGPVLAATRGADRVGPSPARLVLVPAGVLGVVPWHAARRATDTGWRYAVQDAELSVAASARLWCDAATRPRPATGEALILGDPRGDLPTAAAEAAAIHRAFYPTGVHLGHPTATRDALGAWLTRDGAPPCPVLHAAGHALVDADRPARSHLRLADGDLRVGDLLELLGGGSRDLGTVVLAGCTTSVAGGAYDEALSLATAFLVGGARSVVGSLWSVPSRSTSLLMFVLHHHLAAAPDQPARALRLAQEWMLDPARVYPPELPESLYAEALSGRLADAYRWAGFSHLGR